MASIKLSKTFFAQTGRQNYGTEVDTRVDALLHHVATQCDVKSIMYHNGQYVPCAQEGIEVAPGIAADIHETQDDRNGGAPINLDVRLHSESRSTAQMRKFIEECNDIYRLDQSNKLENRLCVFEQANWMGHSAASGPFVQDVARKAPAAPHLLFTKHEFVTSRTLDNVFFENRDTIKNRLEFFLNHRDWYDRKGIPWMLGFLFHGVGGCGKTSTIKAIGNMTGRHIICVSLDSIKTKTQLRALFQNEELHVAPNGGSPPEVFRIPLNKRLIVLEDVDAASHIVLNRQSQPGSSKFASPGSPATETEEDGITLADLLNTLDGPVEHPGRILIMTTNHPERLDPALIRKVSILSSASSTLALHLCRFGCSGLRQLVCWKRRDASTARCTSRWHPPP
jgi:hypothetical protein